MNRSPSGILATTLTTILLCGCGPKHRETPRSSPALPAARVSVQTAEIKTRPMTEEVLGTIRATRRAALEAKVNGRIAALPVALGDQVQKGQLIARLDAGEIAARQDQAQASLEQAERDWSRSSSLFERGGVTRAEYDSAQSRLGIARGAVAETRAMVGYLEVTAPFDGVVARKSLEVGDLAGPGRPLIDLEDPSALQLQADIPEGIAARVERGARLEFRVDSVSGMLSGTVRELAPIADPGTRTFQVKLDVSPTPGLMPGQFARLIVPIGEANSLRVPLSAVVRRGQLEMVFVAAHQQAQLHLVKTGRRVGDEMEILSGLDAGDSVVVDGAAQLTDGQPLEVK